MGIRSDGMVALSNVLSVHELGRRFYLFRVLQLALVLTF